MVESHMASLPTGHARAACPTISGYEILGPIGHGAMGEVTLARQVNLNRLVAIKWLRLPGPDLNKRVERFRREAQLTAPLSHHHILTIYDYGMADERPYLVMEYVEEGDLRRLLKPGVPLPVDQARAILAAVSGAVGYLHGRGILHRDLKPENILMQGGTTPKLTDFGIAVLREAAGHLTQDCERLGTPGYVAPEQQYNLPIDERTDQYSLAALAYEILTGHKPLGVFEPPSSHNPALTPRLDGVIRRALSESPSDRFESVAVFARELDEALRTPPPATTPAPPRNLPLRRLLVVLLGLCVIASAWIALHTWQTYQGSLRAMRSLSAANTSAQAAPSGAKADTAIQRAADLEPAEKPLSEDQVVTLWAYKLWLLKGGTHGDRDAQDEEANRAQALIDTRAEIERRAYANWVERGSLVFDDAEKDQIESELNWNGALRQVYNQLIVEIGELEASRSALKPISN